MAIRGWDLSSGRPVPLARRSSGGEVVVATVRDPWTFIRALDASVWEPVVDVSWKAEIWELDPRMVLAVKPFFRRSGWFQSRVAAGLLPVSEILNDEDGKNFSGLVSTIEILCKDSATGEIHVLGELASDAWLNGGTVPDGVEVDSAADGIRIRIEGQIPKVWAYPAQGGGLSLYGPDPESGNQSGTAVTWDSVATYDLVLGVKVLPDVRLGCEGLGEEIPDSMVLRFDEAVVLSMANGGT